MSDSDNNPDIKVVLNELLESIHKIIRENPNLKEENVVATLKRLRKEATIHQDV